MSELVPVCFRCGTGLIWNGSDEWGDEENGGNREYYACPHCGNDYEVCEIPENQKDDFEYWNNRKNLIGGGKS